MNNKKFRTRKEKTEEIENPEHSFNAKERKRGGKTKPGSGIKPTYRGTNDIRWYATDSQLLQDVGRFSFNLPAGSDIPRLLAGDGTTFTQNIANVYRVPGIMSVGVIPTVGISNDATSPVNLAAQLIYNKLRVEISGARSYDQTDVMHYLIGADSAFCYYAFLLRLYGVMNNFNFLNKHTPRALVTAMSVSYDSIATNMAQFRAYINMYAKRLSVLVVPNTMPIIERHFKMLSGIYKDSESPKAQFILYNPVVLHAYNPIDSQTGGGFESVYLRTKWTEEYSTAQTNVLLTFNQLQEVGDELLLHLNDEDIMNIAGDMLKAFGEGGIWKQDFIPDNFAIEPVFDFTWLTQVQNLTVVPYRVENNQPTGIPDVVSPYHMAVTIPGNEISPYIIATCSGTTEYSAAASMLRPKFMLLTSPYDNPKPEDIMESTRLTSVINTRRTAGSSSGTYVNTFEVESCGSEIVTQLDIYTYRDTSTHLGELIKIKVDTVIEISSNTEPPVVSALKMLPQNLALLDTFAMHPTVYMMYHQANGDKYAVLNPFADVDNFSIAGPSDIEALHMVALLNELFISNVGFVK
jgi:hypothetical protein